MLWDAGFAGSGVRPGVVLPRRLRATRPDTTRCWCGCGQVLCCFWGPHHSPAQAQAGEIPRNNPDPAATTRAFRRFAELTRALKARVIIQHEPADIASLPWSPRAAD